jgi:2-hydroxychromene-2-carboxylate isomerase
MIEFFFDCSSPWTYFAFRGVQALAAEFGREIAWRPFLVGGVFNTVNPTVYEGRAAGFPPPKARYFDKDLADWARFYGLQVKFPPSVFPVNSVKAMRGCLWLEPQGKLPAFAEAVFDAYWRQDLDISQDPVLARVCEAAGVDPQAFFAAIAEPAIKDRLRANTDELIARGGFGTPTIFLDGEDMYFGNDRLPLVRAALARG